MIPREFQVELKTVHVTFAGQDGVFEDVCLINALRCFGYKIPYVDHGPFWAQADGNRFLAPYGCLCCKCDAVAFCYKRPPKSSKALPCCSAPACHQLARELRDLFQRAFCCTAKRPRWTFRQSRSQNAPVGAGLFEQ